ncbi:39S ribosomal protein L3, mitochondrial [Armadillidium nasatum]|uniref:Large ribosomal subunit protein uL3m n=1 Tax=Armadillidium nasatum TaxID=96803 RepID=A0A5N5SSG1_9CRUS|nr:39S ribosomal protein L3, mitochondrial [Armadillidium nasatum]
MEKPEENYFVISISCQYAPLGLTADMALSFIVSCWPVSDNHVIKYIPPEELEKNDFKLKRRVQRKDRPLGALIVGTGAASPTQFTKEYFNLFQEAGVMPKRRLTKFLITPNAKLPPGFPLYAAHFRPGDVVDCAGITTDRGFQGVMKRWQFKGGPATHGNTKSHRRPGNIGGGGGAKARVWPGTKMPGHMGRHRRTLVGQKVLRVNTKYNVIWVMGRAVPGEIGNYVIIYDTMLPLRRKSQEKAKLLFPTYFPDEEELPENLFDESIHDFRLPSITFAEDEK